MIYDDAMSGLRIDTGRLRKAIPSPLDRHTNCKCHPYLEPGISRELLNNAIRRGVRNLLSGVMRQNANVDADLIRNAEIRTVVDVS
jgi:hypothetical protein